MIAGVGAGVAPDTGVIETKSEKNEGAEVESNKGNG